MIRELQEHADSGASLPRRCEGRQCRSWDEVQAEMFFDLEDAARKHPLRYTFDDVIGTVNDIPELMVKLGWLAHDPACRARAWGDWKDFVITDAGRSTYQRLAIPTHWIAP